MSASVSVVFEIAHQQEAVPLVWLAVTRNREAAFWWIALAFGVSWLADTVAHWLPWGLMSLAYPVSQAAIIGAVLLSRRDAEAFLFLLLAVGLWAVWLNAPRDWLLHTVAFGGVVAMVWKRWTLGWLRTSLLIGFGGWLIAWWGYVIWPGWGFYLAYQSCRFIGILCFCKAATRKQPRLALA